MKYLIDKLSNEIMLKLAEIAWGTIELLKDKFFYIGILTLFLGIELNLYSQGYLLTITQNGTPLPVLYDLILDNIPLLDIDFLYDIFSILSLFVFFIYVVHVRDYKKVPYFLMIVGIFQLFRGFFIVLTPFGNPMGFNGTGSPFFGFANIELGVYPSGHTGVSFLFYLLVKDKRYKQFLLFCLLVIIISLFLSRGHYTIDILSGIIFAYAIKSFADKNLLYIIMPQNIGVNKI